MIEWLKIKNLALVQDAEIDLGKGLNIISGETGAGKSVIISAISILFGERADKNVIRTGENKCELSAGINIPKYLLPRINPILEANSIELNPTGELAFRRVLTQSSSRSFINDTSVTLDTLSSIADFLLDFHGPEEHHSLLNNNNLLSLIDSYGECQKKRKEVETIYTEIKSLEKELGEIEKDLPNPSETEYLRHLISDISKVEPKPNEDFELYSRYKIVSNSKSLIESANDARYLLYDSENSVHNGIASVIRKLSDAEKIDERNIAKFSESLGQISSLVKDLNYDIEDYASKIELDEGGFLELENRLGAISNLKKKYGPAMEDVILAKEKAQKKLDLIDNFAFVKGRLNSSLNEKTKSFLSVATELSKLRKKAGGKFAEETAGKLKTLGFLNANLIISFSDTTISSSGIDKLEVLFSANKGEKLAPLKSVASSGELSRIMLAIKTVLSNSDLIPILIFDEIDANIGGEVANEVGTELKKLGKEHQVICISHLAQVASFADYHFLVRKEVKNERTFTEISLLSDSNKVKELSRMLGGGKAAVAHASDMLKKKNS